MNGTVRPSPAIPLGLVAFLATSIMLFTAFTASYLVRRTSADWREIEMPGTVWLSTILMAASSLTVERARRNRPPRNVAWLGTTVLLGVGFLIAQVVVWMQLANQGVFLRSHPNASFFYVLTAVHGLHLIGGLLALGRAWTRPERLGVYALYWHFVGIVWLYILILLTAL